MSVKTRKAVKERQGATDPVKVIRRPSKRKVPPYKPPSK